MNEICKINTTLLHITSTVEHSPTRTRTYITSMEQKLTSVVKDPIHYEG